MPSLSIDCFLVGLVVDGHFYQFDLRGGGSKNSKSISADLHDFVGHRDTLMGVQNESGHSKIVIGFRKRQTEAFVYIVDFHTAAKQIGMGAELFGYDLARVMFVLYVTKNLFYQILQSDHAVVYSEDTVYIQSPDKILRGTSFTATQDMGEYTIFNHSGDYYVSEEEEKSADTTDSARK